MFGLKWRAMTHGPSMDYALVTPQRVNASSQSQTCRLCLYFNYNDAANKEQ
jgi:hypothetical protein